MSETIMDLIPLPFTLYKWPDGRYTAEWKPEVPTKGIPKTLRGDSESNATHAIERLKEKMIEVGLL